jgi:hypothetical protein
MDEGTLLDVFRKKDPGLAVRLQQRAEQQDQWNDVFSTKLIELLDKVDAIRSETFKRLRRAEELTIAEAALYEASTEHQRLAQGYKQAALSFQSATESLSSARELAAQADVVLQGATKIAFESEQVFSAASGKLEMAETRILSAEQILQKAMMSEDRANHQLADANSVLASVSNQYELASRSLRIAKRIVIAALIFLILFGLTVGGVWFRHQGISRSIEHAYKLSASQHGAG